ncbi:hypothetical protein [Fulvivirga sediminis]|uniref:Uncharacterized protein n=1 Tax=Fulvivirga sediminis TaxID=2803949 RepID=A0A937F5T4_9BACT|nr:hypothetical protein [Fulvivirga sediminis]MBL3656285.1 hypothetical protein [Fulvivirga sediminis]
MDIHERLKYCKICSNRAYNNYGVVCKLTNDKPQFKNRCPYFIEDSAEREAYEARLFDEKIRNGSFASKNFYSTHERLILLAQHYLPAEFRIKRYKIGLYALTSMFLIMMG